jgi:DNA-binding transcriptional LysR family regulator
VQVRAAAWLNEQVPGDHVVLRTGSLVTQLQAARAGLGLAVLPCYLADPEDDLERLFPPLEHLARELWIVTHDDLRGTARVRAFLTVAGDAIADRRALIEGREPRRATAARPG